MEWSDRIGRRIKLRDLHILLAVAECGSMAKAAEHLAISQPVVSKVIADTDNCKACVRSIRAGLAKRMEQLIECPHGSVATSTPFDMDFGSLTARAATWRLDPFMRSI